MKRQYGPKIYVFHIFRKEYVCQTDSKFYTKNILFKFYYIFINFIIKKNNGI